MNHEIGNFFSFAIPINVPAIIFGNKPREVGFGFASPKIYGILFEREEERIAACWHAWSEFGRENVKAYREGSYYTIGFHSVMERCQGYLRDSGVTLSQRFSFSIFDFFLRVC